MVRMKKRRRERERRGGGKREKGWLRGHIGEPPLSSSHPGRGF
jgi:hypothetical protein